MCEYNEDDLPEPEDEQWSGTEGMNDERVPIHAAICDLLSVRFVNMAGGGPFDGGICTMMQIQVSKVDKTQKEPVYLILSPEDSVGMVRACLGYLEALDEDGFDEFNEDDIGI